MSRAAAEAVSVEAEPALERDARELARRHYENFPVLSRLLPADLRASFAALYAFARVTDDLGDEGGASREERLRSLERWERALDEALAAGEAGTGRPSAPVLRDVAALVTRRGLPPEPLRDLIRANRRDQLQSRYATWADLLGYCRLSARPVGRLVLHLFGVRDPAVGEQADAVCTALQLANHWQGIGPDLRLRDRLYVPLEDLRAFGVDETDLLRDRPSRAVRALLGFEIDRTRVVLASGAGLPAALPRPARSVVRLFVRGGAAILDELEARLDDVLRGGVRVPGRRAALELALEEARRWL